MILIATGSEVEVALGAQRLLQERGIAARVVSMPSWELFEAQTQEYRDAVLPPAVTARLAIEAGNPLGWFKYVGLQGDVVRGDRFGASRAGEDPGTRSSASRPQRGGRAGATASEALTPVQ